LLQANALGGTLFASNSLSFANIPFLPGSMSIKTYPKALSEIKSFPKLFTDYIDGKDELKSFFGFWPEMKNIPEQVNLKKESYSMEMRRTLVESLEKQYARINLTKAQNENLENLKKENTFSISCGHQLNIAGGPLYVAYKILSVIRYCEVLNQAFPQNQFVPIHWLANEDHDLEEISSFTFFGQQYSFDLQGSGASGEVSTEGLQAQFQAIRDFPAWMAQAYENQENLNLATQDWIQAAFGEAGLLVLDANQESFKKAFLPFALRELENGWVEKEVLSQSGKLLANGHKAQINPRPINLFYLGESERLRIEKKENGYQTHDGKYKWTEKEALVFFSRHPEKLSPNVAFRPFFSQLILPDVAFVGGPAEISYWLQLKSVFDQAKTPFPMLIPRFSGLFVQGNQVKKMQKLGLTPEDLFKEEHQIKKELINLAWQKPDLELAYQGLIELCKTVDSTLVPTVKAELVKVEKQIENLEKRIIKSAEQKNEQEITQIKNLISKLFPEGGLQERKESWLSFMSGNPDWLPSILKSIVPFDFNFLVMMEEV
jgi:bacillithiol biosynthesis cysteine-adding enzyme BshC